MSPFMTTYFPSQTAINVIWFGCLYHFLLVPRVVLTAELCCMYLEFMAFTVVFWGVTAARHSVDCVKEVLKYGATINHQIYTEDTALHHAAENKQLDIITCLLEHGADMMLRNEAGLTPLFVTCHRNAPDCLTTLIKRAESKGKCLTNLIKHEESKGKCLTNLIKHEE